MLLKTVCLPLRTQWRIGSHAGTHCLLLAAYSHGKCCFVTATGQHAGLPPTCIQAQQLPPDMAQVYSLDKAGEYRHQVDTQRLGVPYFVRNVAALDKSHPTGSRDRRVPFSLLLRPRLIKVAAM